jgi:ADP-heptose:LPS heptosyltransferase
MGKANADGILKQIELAIRRAFIFLLSLRSSKASLTSCPDLGESPTILFLRQDRLGDAIITTPLLVALRNKYPTSKFIMLLGENNRDIAPLLPIQTEIIIYKKKPIEALEMLWKLRRRKIDVLIDLMDNPSATSSILTAAIGATCSIGIAKDNASSYSILVPLIDRRKYHIIRRIAELLRPFGIDPESISLKPILLPYGIKKIKGKLGLNISAGQPNRRATNDTNAAIALGAINSGIASNVVLYYHPSDSERAKQIIAIAGDSRIRLADAIPSFEAFAREIATCELLITPDTSTLHLASAYGIPVVGLFPPSPPTLHYWTPMGVEYEMVIHGPTFETLEAEDVLEALLRLSKRLKANDSKPPIIEEQSITHVA